MEYSNKKYRVKLFNRNTPDTDLLDDIKRVANEYSKSSLSLTEYNKIGKYHSSTINHRFNGWNNALTLAGLEIRKHNSVSKNELLKDLKSVAKVLDKNSLTQEEYLTYGRYSVSPFIKAFGTWFNALESVDLKRSRNYKVTNEQYFENIENIWTTLGRQPKYKEIEKPFSQYSAGAYERRFGSWSNALKEFEAFMNSDVENKIEKISSGFTNEVLQGNTTIKHKTDRNINLRMRFHILSRDNFMCVKCGRRPPEVKLHVDHICPYSKGGETLPENLQTLCDECNNGKSNVL